MSTHLDIEVYDLQITSYSDARSIGSDETLVTLDNYIEGPLKQIEAARKALHSPSLNARKRSTFDRVGSHAGDMRKYGEGMAGQKAGRKCLSRAQMSEPYELSQDLLDKQNEVLSNKYGGQGVANSAANTIQRAYRRYSMAKKFAAITSAAQIKNENRLSRRFAGMAGGGSSGGGMMMQQHHHHNLHQQGSTTVTTGALCDGVRLSHQQQQQQHLGGGGVCGDSFHHTCCVSGKTSYVGLAKAEARLLGNSKSSSHDNSSSSSVMLHDMHRVTAACLGGNHHPPSSSSSYSTSNLPPPGHHDCHTFNCPSRGGGVVGHQQWPGHPHIGVLPHGGSSQEDDSVTAGVGSGADNAEAEMQSFPIDYHLADRSALTCSSAGVSSSSSSSRQQQQHQQVMMSHHQLVTGSRQISTGRMIGPSHAHCANCGSGQALPSHHSHHGSSSRGSPASSGAGLNSSSSGRMKRAPDVPKRTVSRLTSLDVGESSELYPSPRSGEQHHHQLMQQHHHHHHHHHSGRHSEPQSRATSNQSSPRVGLSEHAHSSASSSSSTSSSSASQQQLQHANLEPKLSLQNNSTLTSPGGVASAMMAVGGHKLSMNGGGGGSGGRDVNRNNVRHAATAGQSVVDSGIGADSSGLGGMGRTKDFYHPNYAVNEVIRKRHYRTGLNIFNKKPEKGITYLISKGFLDNSPAAVARFLITRKGLSKQMIGEYLGNISHPFNQAVLTSFANEMDLSGMQVDVALRKFQTYFRMPGEAQKIERLMEVFSQRYCNCNPSVVSKLNSTDTIFILAFAIILLNTDLHTPNLKPEKRMKPDDFIRNLRGIDEGADVDRESLVGIYERIRVQEFKPGSDHVTQVMKVQQTIVAKCPNLAVPYRRLVCYCRLYEVQDKNKKDRPGQHQREVFLFNDILVITKIHSRRKNSVTYTFRNSFLLTGMLVSLFENSFYSHGIALTQRWDRKVVITLNARNDHDRSKFVEDLRESIAEMDEMETLRIEAELEKQHVPVPRVAVSQHDNRDSGVGHDCDPQEGHNRSRYAMSTESNVNLKRSAINNSLLDLVDTSHHGLTNYQGEKPVRRGSVGSLDSGMSVSFQSGSAGSAGTVSQESSPQQLQAAPKTGPLLVHQLAAPRTRKLASNNNMSTNL